MSSMGTRCVLGLVAFGCLAAVGACSSPDPFDRAGAVEGVLTQSGGQLTRPQAECYVDRVLAELGSGALTPGTQPPSEMVPRLTRLRIDCTGVGTLGTDPPTAATAPEAGLGTQPNRLGDDAMLDDLYAACRDAGGSACDRLFDLAPLGSEYEDFASTCGGRTKELSCAATYPDGRQPPPATTAASTTISPSSPPGPPVSSVTSTRPPGPTSTRR